MIIDAHCHAWHSWPYDAAVVDRDRGSVERLIGQFDRNGVDHGLLIAARIGADDPRTDNQDNNSYLAEAVGRYPHRLSLCVDVDSFWDPLHHSDGAADRLRSAAESTLPILIHHQGHVPTAEDRYPEEIRPLLDNARHPNIMIKVSGFYYLTADRTGYPYPAVLQRLRRLHRAFGADRLIWGSDRPVARQFLSYRQTLELITTHATFLDDHDRQLILGENLKALLRNDP